MEKGISHFKRRRALIPQTVAFLLLALASSWLASPALALDPKRSLDEFKHTRWTRADGAPSGVTSIAQTADGYLWLASNDGLFRFDGIAFQRMDDAVDLNADGSPFYVLNTRDDGLWVYYYKAKRIRAYKAGLFSDRATPVQNGTVISITQTVDGDIWLVGGSPGQPLYRFRKNKWHQVQPRLGQSRDILLSVVVSLDGSVWVGSTDAIYRRSMNSDRFDRVLERAGAQYRLLLDSRGRVWALGDGVSRLVGNENGQPAMNNTQQVASDVFKRRGRPLFDRNGNLWIARRKDGLELLAAPTLSTRGGKPSEYRVTDGLTSDTVNTIFEDREGNIWVGTSLGLDRFRSTDIVADRQLSNPASFGDVLYSDRDGTVYIGQREAIYKVLPGRAPQPILTDGKEPEAICEGIDRSIWIAFEDRFTVLSNGRANRLPKPRELEAGIKDCGLDRFGRFWASAAQSGLFRWTGTSWRRERLAPDVQPGAMVRDSAGDLWAIAGAGSLLRLDRGGPTQIRYGGPETLRTLRTVAAARSGLLLVSEDALGWFRGGQLSVASARQFGNLSAVNGVVQTIDGDEVWLFRRDGVVRVKAKDLQRAFKNPGYRVVTRTFDYLDGLTDSNAVRTQRTLTQGGDHRLWLTTATGTVWLDPKRLTFNPHPPKVAVSSLSTSGTHLYDVGRAELEPGVSNITINFAVLGLRMPERNRVRYKLEGQDEGWIDPGLRRQAFYTNLTPGSYRFRVIGANESGIWNRAGSSVDLVIQPTFLQSTMFKVLIAACLALVALILYRFRTRQLTERLQSRFDIRVGERERIARELHDTLLQGFQGLLLQFKAVANRVANDSNTRSALDAAIARAQAMLIEGRDRVRELRSDAHETNLGEALLSRAEREVQPYRIRLVLTQEGAPRPLHPLVHQELQAIAEEAIRNAAQHARAQTLNIYLLWGKRNLRLAIRDDGTGLDTSVATHGGRPGHFGLLGMRERAKRLGAKIAFTSREGDGLEVLLELPAHAAYAGYATRLTDRLFSLFVSSDRKEA